MGDTQHMDRALWQEPRARGQLGAALLCPSSAEAPSCCSFAEPRVRVCYYKHFITFCVQSLTSPCAGAAKTASLKLLLNALLFFYNFFPHWMHSFLFILLIPESLRLLFWKQRGFSPSRSLGLCAVKAAELLSSSNKYY